MHFVGRILLAKEKDYKAGICCVISVAFIYNPVLTMAALQERGASGVCGSYWGSSCLL